MGSFLHTSGSLPCFLFIFHTDSKHVLTIKALFDQAPNYIKDLLTPNEPQGPQRSAKGDFCSYFWSLMGDFRVIRLLQSGPLNLRDLFHLLML